MKKQTILYFVTPERDGYARTSDRRIADALERQGFERCDKKEYQRVVRKCEIQERRTALVRLRDGS